jgi:hypothetical protein
MSARETIKEAYERLHKMETDEIVDYAYDLEQELSIEREKLKKIEELCIENIESCNSTIGNEVEQYKKILSIIKGDE